MADHFNTLDSAGTVETVEFTHQGSLAPTFTSTAPWYPPYNCTITAVRASLGVAPSVQAVKVDVQKNGTSIYAVTTANRPSVAASAKTALGGAPDTTALTTADYLTVSATQADTAGAADTLVVQVSYTRSA